MSIGLFGDLTRLEMDRYSWYVYSWGPRESIEMGSKYQVGITCFILFKDTLLSPIYRKSFTLKIQLGDRGFFDDL